MLSFANISEVPAAQTNDQASLAKLAEELRLGSRAALARAVTLVESRHPDHRRRANVLLDLLMPLDSLMPSDSALPLDSALPSGSLTPGRTNASTRIGISGTPGVGKSTFIEAFGSELVEQGHRVAVLAIDPSSSLTGGSILGDKTRMPSLTRSDQAYIRPTPTGGTLGGVASATADTILLTEAAGYDVVIVETVGIGQSETAVADMTDLFLLLVAPAGGDDLQGIKRGVMELVDLVAINKADGVLAPIADNTAADYRGALSLLRPRRGSEPPPVLTCSAIEGTGIAQIWSEISALSKSLALSGELEKLRSAQYEMAMNRSIEETLLRQLTSDKSLSQTRQSLARAVAARQRSASSAASEFVELVSHPATNVSVSNQEHGG